MSYIYIAQSESFPGMVKVGRTKRDVAKRMNELSESDYGITGFSDDSQWEAIKVIDVENEVLAEKIAHDYMSDLRVEDSRELFYVDNPNSLANELETITNGTIVTSDTFDLLNILNPLSLAMIGVGVVVTGQTFFPDNPMTEKAEEFMYQWEKKLKSYKRDAKHPATELFFEALHASFKFSQITGFILMRPLWGKRDKQLAKKKRMNELGDPNSEKFKSKLDNAYKRFQPFNESSVNYYVGWVFHCKKCNYLKEQDLIDIEMNIQLFNKGGDAELVEAINNMTSQGNIYHNGICDFCFLHGDNIEDNNGHNVDWYFKGKKVVNFRDGMLFEFYI